jgi:hypothetical protein
MTIDPERSFGLLLLGELNVGRVGAALAQAASVPVGDVDVAPEGVMERNWEAAVLCTYEAAAGSVTWMLDLFLSAQLESPPGPESFAAILAEGIGEPVLYQARPFSDTSYWLADPAGWRTRARIEDVDGLEVDDRPVIAVTAVQRAVSSLPEVPVDPLPEVIRDLRMPVPVRDEWLSWAESVLREPVVTGDAVWFAHTRLGAWEQLTARMGAGWPPDGWYPIDYYREDLETRDELAGAAANLPESIAGRFAAALAAVDEAFRSETREVDPAVLSDSGPRGWWWGRVPDPEPWKNTPRDSGQDWRVAT